MKNKIIIPEGYRRIRRSYKPRSGDAWIMTNGDMPVEACSGVEEGHFRNYNPSTILLRPKIN